MPPREYGSFGGLGRNEEERWIEGFVNTIIVISSIDEHHLSICCLNY